MNFEDVRVGQILVDKDGNQFEVMEIDRMDDDLPVFLKLVKHISAFAVPGNEYEVMELGQGFLDSEFWIDRELLSTQKEEFSVHCIDVDSLSLFVGAPKTADEVIKNHDRNFKQSKACAEAEELEDIVHDMFVLPTPEEMRQLVMQHQLDDVSQVIRDAAKRGETSVNLPEDQVDGVAGALMAAGYQVYFTKHLQRCIISW